MPKKDFKTSSDLKVRKQVIKKQKAPADPRKVLGNKWVMLGTFISLLIFISIVLNWIINTINLMIKMIANHFDKNGFSQMEQLNKLILGEIKQPSNIFLLNDYPIIFYPLLIIGGFLIGKRIYKTYIRFRKIDYGQLGDSRFLTQKELEQQYRRIPQIVEEYDGESGFPISHYKQDYYICDDTFNVLINGTSRSGKGVTSVMSSMDIDSRAKIKPSLVVSDPKGEIAGASYETLRRRGYDVEILNIDNPMNGMSYNPLYLITEYYKRGQLDSAQKYTKSLTHTLFHDPKMKDPTWNNYASSTTQSLILAVVDYCLKNNEEEKITMRNVYNMLITYAGKTYMDQESGEERSLLDDYMENLAKHNPQHPAVIAYGTVQFSKGKTRSSIFTTVSGKLDDINKDGIAKMMSRHTIDFRRVGFNKYIQMEFDRSYKHREGQMIIGKDDYNFKIDENGLVDLNFKSKLNTNDEITIKVKDEIIKLHTNRKPKLNALNVPRRDKFTREIILNNWLEVEIEDASPIIKAKVHYSEKPIAIFMNVPDYDSSEHFIASIFISQLYTELAREASKTKGNKCYTRVKFRMDEVGNFPPIADMASIMTVCLGRNILFELYLQELSQLESSYTKEEAKTIISNCQNKVYIKATSYETAEEFSKLAGEKTVESISRSSGSFDIDVNENRSLEKRRIITPDELLNFVMGETMVLRPLKTKDLKGRDVRPYPILNSGKHQMPRAFDSISQWFDTARNLSEFSIPSKHQGLDLMSNNIDFNHMQKTVGGYTIKAYVDPSRHGRSVYDELKQYIMDNFNLSSDLEFRELVNQENQEAFYEYLERLCNNFKVNFNDSRIEVNEILSKSDHPVEAPITAKTISIEEQLENRLYFIPDNFTEQNYKQLKTFIENSSLKSKDKEYLMNEATIGDAREILELNEMGNLFENSFTQIKKYLQMEGE